MPPTYVMFIRRARAGFALGPYVLPAGSKLVLSALVTHHMPDVWPDPDRFRPARWDAHKPTLFELLLFGAGPPVPGATFADVELRVLLAMIV